MAGLLDAVRSIATASLYVRDLSDDTFIAVSEGWLALTGYERADVESRHGFWRERIHEEDRRSVERAGAGRDGHHELQYRFRRADGGYVWIRDIAAPGAKAADASAPNQLQGSWVSIATEKSLANELASSRRALDDLSKKADDVAESKYAFLATMSQEIRSPLYGMTGTLELLLETELSDDQERLVKTVLESGENLLSLIDNTLDISKIEDGTFWLQQIEFDVRELVEDAVDLFAASAMQKNVELAGSLAPDIPARVHGDPARLGQVISTLIQTAVDSIEWGSVLVTVAVDEVTDGTARIVFEVEDKGVGIDVSSQEEVFDEHSQPASRYHGAALSMAICRELVQLMGGHVTVEANEDRRSALRFSVPLEIIRPAVAHAQLAVERVLVVQQEDITSEVLARYLVELGASCTFARTTQNALRTLAEASESESGGFDALVVDVGLARSDELLAGLRRGPHAQLPVIGLHGPKVDAKSAEFAAVSTWVPKPVRRERLIEAFAAATGAAEVVSASLGRVLVAEDRALQQQLTRDLLESHVDQLEFAPSGDEVRSALCTQPRRYDVAFVVPKLPDAEGSELIAQLRSWEHANKAKPMKIVALVGDVPDCEREAYIAAGADELLAKTAAESEVSRLVEVLGIGGSAPQTSRPSASMGPPIDAELLSQLRSFLADDFGLLVEEAVVEVPALVKEIEKSAQACDVVRLRDVTTKLKRLCHHIGAEPLAGIAHELLVTDDDGQMSGVDKWLHATRVEAGRLVDMLQDLLTKKTAVEES